MKLRHIPALLLLASTTAFASNNPTPDHQQYVSIPFANLGGIQNWQAVGHDAIKIQGRRRNDWYLATFMRPCFALTGSVAVGFVLQPSGSVDRFSSIIVDGEQCWFKSLEKLPPQEAGKTAKSPTK